MKCKISEWCCVYHACMSDDCQKRIVIKQGVNWGKGKCSTLNTMKITDKTFTIDQRLLALSWKEPYGSLMLHGKIETRSWKTNYRGWVLICCSKIPYNSASVLNISGMKQMNRMGSKLGYVIFGKPQNAIALGRLVHCRPMTKTDEDSCFVQYHEGLWCHIYQDVQPIQPFLWKGTQGWKELDVTQKQMVFSNLNSTSI